MQIPSGQAGFMSGRDTRERILNGQKIIKKCRGFNIPAVLRFMDYAKAFDYMNWQKLFEVLREMRVPAHIVDLVESLCEINSMVVRVYGEESEAFGVEQVVRQGCILSSQLFNVHKQHIIREALEH